MFFFSQSWSWYFSSFIKMSETILLELGSRSFMKLSIETSFWLWKLFISLLYISLKGAWVNSISSCWRSKYIFSNTLDLISFLLSTISPFSFLFKIISSKSISSTPYFKRILIICLSNWYIYSLWFSFFKVSTLRILFLE